MKNSVSKFNSKTGFSYEKAFCFVVSGQLVWLDLRDIFLAELTSGH